MTWDQYRKRLEEKNPELAEETTVMRITVGSFLKQLRAAYEQGEDHQKELHKTLKSFESLMSGALKP